MIFSTCGSAIDTATQSWPARRSEQQSWLVNMQFILGLCSWVAVQFALFERPFGHLSLLMGVDLWFIHVIEVFYMGFMFSRSFYSTYDLMLLKKGLPNK